MLESPKISNILSFIASKPDSFPAVVNPEPRTFLALRGLKGEEESRVPVMIILISRSIPGVSEMQHNNNLKVSESYSIWEITLYIKEERENTSTSIREKNNYRVDKKTTS